MSTVTIPSRFNGPARSGNGGYAAGVVGELVEGPARVKLHVPPPLDTPFQVEVEGSRVMASHEGATILEASPSGPPDIPTPFVPFDEAEAAMKGFRGWHDHAAPTCFVCGTERHDGLRIHPGSLNRDGLVASVWTPDETVADEGGQIEPRVIWGALDCPGAWAAWAYDNDGDAYFPALGLMTADLLAPVRRDEPYIVVAQYLSTEGRKVNTSCAIYSAGGELKASAIHVEVKVPNDWAS